MIQTNDNNGEKHAEIIRVFKRRRTIRIWITVIILSLLIGVTIAGFPDWNLFGLSKLQWAPYLYLIMFGLLVAIGLVWRCPACNGLLGDVFNTRHCPKCGYNFRK